MGSDSPHEKKGHCLLGYKTAASLAQLRLFSSILSPSHPLRNIKSSSQLSSSPFSFLNLFFLTSFLCNYYQQSESFFFFFIVTMERTIFSSRKGGGEEGEGRGKNHIRKLRASLGVFSTISN